MDKVLLIDAYNSIWRASIGFAPKASNSPPSSDWEMSETVHLSNKIDDRFVIIFNFFRNLRPIIEKFSPDKCFFVLEGHPQFRYDLLPSYKANRIIKQAAKQNLKDKFQQSKNEIVRLMQYLSITCACAHNYEADDTIASLVDNMREEQITVLSSDNDYIQLLQKGYTSCQVYDPIKKVFKEAPTYPFVAWKCLNGDKSDNIPKCLSPKKALATVNNPYLFKTFMEVEENRANFSINRQLIEFANIPVEEIILQDGNKNFDALKKEFVRMNFQSIINDKSWEKFCKTFDCLRF